MGALDRARLKVQSVPLLDRFLVPLPLMLLGGLAVTLLAFIWLSDAVVDGDVGVIDQALLSYLVVAADNQPPVWLVEFARDVTALGSVGIILMVTTAAVGLLLLQGNQRSGRRPGRRAGWPSGRHAAQVGLRSAAPGDAVDDCACDDSQLSQRSRPEFGSSLSHARRTGCPHAAAYAPACLCRDARDRPDADDRLQPHLSRRPLAKRRARRMGHRFGLGDAMLAGRDDAGAIQRAPTSGRRAGTSIHAVGEG